MLLSVFSAEKLRFSEQVLCSSDPHLLFSVLQKRKIAKQSLFAWFLVVKVGQVICVLIILPAVFTLLPSLHCVTPCSHSRCQHIIFTNIPSFSVRRVGLPVKGLVFLSESTPRRFKSRRGHFL